MIQSEKRIENIKKSNKIQSNISFQMKNNVSKILTDQMPQVNKQTIVLPKHQIKITKKRLPVDFFDHSQASFKKQNYDQQEKNTLNTSQEMTPRQIVQNKNNQRYSMNSTAQIQQNQFEKTSYFGLAKNKVIDSSKIKNQNLSKRNYLTRAEGRDKMERENIKNKLRQNQIFTPQIYNDSNLQAQIQKNKKESAFKKSYKISAFDEFLNSDIDASLAHLIKNRLPLRSSTNSPRRQVLEKSKNQIFCKNNRQLKDFQNITFFNEKSVKLPQILLKSKQI